MAHFSLLIESNDNHNSSPGDIVDYLRKVAAQVRGCQTSGVIYDRNEEPIGSWTYEMEEAP